MGPISKSGCSLVNSWRPSQPLTMECGTHGPRGNRSVRHALRRLRAIDASTPIDRVLVTGDVTDAGTRAEWVEFLDLIRCHPDLRSRILFVPGNHDVNIVDRTNTGRFDIPWSVGHALRRLRFVVALDGVQGEHVHIVGRESGALGPSVRDYLRDGDRTARLRELAERGTWRGRWEISTVWDDIFPLVAPPTSPGGCGAILLDSNARSHFSATNAIGVVSHSQLKRLKAVLNASPAHPWIVLLHHHVVEYPHESVALGDRIALSLMNAPDVLSAISRHSKRSRHVVGVISKSFPSRVQTSRPRWSQSAQSTPSKYSPTSVASSLFRSR